ncbi:MAG: T9SS type A sorting domain-containing protein [Flavobacteriaceae bacterium]
MKKYILFILFSTVTLNAQVDIPLVNGDMEDTSAPATNSDGKYSIAGEFFINDGLNTFDATASGLAPGKGRNGSQAFKATIGEVELENDAWKISFNKKLIDFQGYGTYKFSFYAKLENALEGRCFWITSSVVDENWNNITSDVLTYLDLDWQGNPGPGGVSSQKWGPDDDDMTTDYLEQTLSFTLSEAAGTTPKYIQLKIDLGRQTNNTFYFDDFTLTYDGPGLSVDDISEKNLIAVYPTVFNEKINVSQLAGVPFKIYNINGSLMLEESKDHGDFVNTASYASGIYMLKAENGRIVKLIKK